VQSLPGTRIATLLTARPPPPANVVNEVTKQPTSMRDHNLPPTGHYVSTLKLLHAVQHCTTFARITTIEDKADKLLTSESRVP